ncbi:MAG: IS5 family transposase [Treponema sp.]|jgi:hypothetical protein|nr:IS5 family transposase [Treponema sp.]
MYKKDNGQISIAEFMSPFGALDPKNRWVRMADMIPWEKYERKYAERFCEDNGAPAIKFRMAMGTLIIKQRTGHSDDEVVEDILENPYMQFLIGLHEFTKTPPFSASSITNFRKYITVEMINEINEEMFRVESKKKNDNDKNNGDGGNHKESDKSAETQNNNPDNADNRGELLLDATCAPAYIKYPTDINLLNEAREKLEGMVDALHPRGYAQDKPRTYRQKARWAYLRIVKMRKPRKGAIRKAIGQQLRFVKRDLNHVERMIQTFGIDNLSENQKQWFETIRELYAQQQQMYDQKVHSVENRIVSIDQPHVRPIVRGKTNAPVEFGAKVSLSLINGYAFTDKIGWDAYNEETLLIPSVENYKNRNGYYPKAVLADKIYRNRENLTYCKVRGIRLSGPRLGRPPKETDWAIIRQERADASQRNAIEGKFGEGKTGYGLDRIMARLKDSSETVIVMAFFCMNLSRRLRVLFRLFQNLLERLFCAFVFVDFRVFG